MAEVNNCNLLDSLPHELMCLILNCCDTYDIVNLSITSKKLTSIWQHVKKIYLPYTSSPKVGLLFDKPFKMLEDFEIHYEEKVVKAVSFDCFKECNNLTRMWVSNKLPVEKPFKMVSNITSLQELTFENLHVFGDTLNFSQHLTQHTRLTSLAIQSNTLEYIQNTLSAARLRSLSLYCARVKSNIADILTPLTNLTHLLIRNVMLLEQKRTILPNLVSLDLGAELDPESLPSYLMTQLTRLLVRDGVVKWHNEDYGESISKFIKLRELSILLPFSSPNLPYLQKLEMNYQTDIYGLLSQLPKLMDLTVHGDLPEKVSELFNLTRLTRLVINDTVPDGILSHISNLSNLVQFQLNKISGRFSADLLDSLQKITTLHHLTIPIKYATFWDDSMALLTQLHRINLLSHSRIGLDSWTKRGWPFDINFVIPTRPKPIPSPYDVGL